MRQLKITKKYNGQSTSLAEQPEFASDEERYAYIVLTLVAYWILKLFTK